MGPGRKMYHKPCLTCKTCSKRLDSYSLVEHDAEPYCKQCHKKNYATTDLRHANLPQAASPASPGRASTSVAPVSPRMPTSPAKLDLASLASLKQDLAQDMPAEPPAQPVTFVPVHVPEPIFEAEEDDNPDEVNEDGIDAEASSSSQQPPPATPPHQISIYSRQPMSPVYSPNQDRNASPSAPYGPVSPRRLSWRASGSPAQATSPTQSSDMPVTTPDGQQPLTPTATGFGKRIVPMSTGGHTVSIPGAYSPKRVTQTFTGNSNTRGSPNGIRPNYTGQGAGPSFSSASPKKIMPSFTGGSWNPGGQRIECPRCAKAVYHAEQVNAVGKRWHKSCLRCTECSTSLDSSRLAEKDGEPYCRACYAKVHGPAGSGYALVGRVA
ncbi:hypothetical protein FRB95_006327 [Tulasnella sp. JGI-2019a]|nr:hypothetical protein FRB93_006140 [Tulasnella sp. JGI-2019a]KAG9028576.1 hypothetical protein FRB95_006327 [Tulasnella sp. JGI-2019a]